MVTHKQDQVRDERQAIRPLLSPTDAADALTSYYALWHDPRRTQLTLHQDAQGRVDGFVAVCQTGADLFRPLVTLRAPDHDVTGILLRASLAEGRPYQVIVPVNLAAAVREHMEICQSGLLHIYRLNPSRFQPVVNVLVQQVSSPDASTSAISGRALRFQIESQGKVAAMAGTNWRSPTFAEVFVYVHPSGRGRGWGRSVVSACTAALLEERLRPLYKVETANESSIRIAEGLGYEDTGFQEFVGEGQLM
jgi:hypothetical protein